MFWGCNCHDRILRLGHSYQKKLLAAYCCGGHDVFCVSTTEINSQAKSSVLVQYWKIIFQCIWGLTSNDAASSHPQVTGVNSKTPANFNLDSVKLASRQSWRNIKDENRPKLYLRKWIELPTKSKSFVLQLQLFLFNFVLLKKRGLFQTSIKGKESKLYLSSADLNCIMDNQDHPLHHTLPRQWSMFSSRQSQFLRLKESFLETLPS